MKKQTTPMASVNLNKPQNILLIDDSATMRSMISSFIEDIKDVKVIEVSNGFDAIKLLVQQSIDLVITDVNMPAMNGFEIAHFVRTHPKIKHIPLIFISTEKNEEDTQKALSFGAAAYITKPFDPQHLKTTLEKTLGLGNKKSKTG